jgi:uncharacterized membrane protein YgdD (TMEM256/DUF423 family)
MKLLGIIGSIGLFLGVVLGAFGAHALRDQLSERMREVFDTGVRYQMYHSLATILAALLSQKSPLFVWAGFLYAAGIVLFSFSLYLLAFTGMRWLGAVTPLGGLCFIAGHLLLLSGFVKM